MKKVNIFVSTVCLFFMLSISVSAASAVMNYSGSGIWNKFSVGTFSINSNNNTVIVNHATSSCGIPNGKLHIDLVKQNSNGGYSAVDWATVSGTGTWKFSYNGVSQGVYKLHFYRDAVYTDGTWDIYGTVYN